MKHFTQRILGFSLEAKAASFHLAAFAIGVRCEVYEEVPTT